MSEQESAEPLYPAIPRPYEVFEGPASGWVAITAGYARGFLRPGGDEAGDLARLAAGETLEFYGGAFRMRARQGDDPA